MKRKTEFECAGAGRAGTIIRWVARIGLFRELTSRFANIRVTKVVQGLIPVVESGVAHLSTTGATAFPVLMLFWDVARIANTAGADLLCALGRRVPRFYLP